MFNLLQRRKALRKTWALIKDINETELISDEEVSLELSAQSEDNFLLLS